MLGLQTHSVLWGTPGCVLAGMGRDAENGAFIQVCKQLEQVRNRAWEGFSTKRQVMTNECEL